MALTRCPECGRIFSDRAEACPRCGCPAKSKKVPTDTNTVLCHLEGINGQVDLYSNRVVIRREGVLAKVTHGFFEGNTEILLKKITAVQLDKGGLLPGHIQFIVPGGSEPRYTILNPVNNGYAVALGSNSNKTVLFSADHNQEAEELKNKIYELL